MTVSSTPRRVGAALLLALTLAALLPGAARAGWFGAQVIDGPAPSLAAAFDVALARDGTGALVWLRPDGAPDHVFAARLAGGRWSAPERVDVGLPAAASEPVVAAAPGGRAVVLWVADGTLFAALRTAGAAAWGAPQVLATGASAPSVGMNLNGTAFASFTVGTDVRAAKLDRLSNAWTVFPTALDADPAQPAGDGPGRRSRLAVSASGTALAAWGETGTDGRTHVFARRILAGGPSAIVNDLALGSLDGRAAGDATSPQVDAEEDDSYAWVVFRQAVADDGGTRVRAVARRLRGSRFEDPVTVDGMSSPAPEDATDPRIAMTGRGEGLATSGRGASLQAVASILHQNAFLPAQRLDGGVVGGVVPAAADDGHLYAAWWQSDGTVHARQWTTSETDKVIAPPGPDTPLSDPALGPVDGAAGLATATDAGGDAVVAFVQAGSDGRRLVVAAFDQPPGGLRGYTTENWRPVARPVLTWAAADDLWGVTYQVAIDGRPAGTTDGLTFTAPAPLPDGVHSWQVTAVDAHGQAVAAPARMLRIDTVAPVLTVPAVRAVKAGRRLTLAVRASDGAPVTPPVSSGLRPVSVDWGDRTAPATVRGTRATHRYARPGRYRITVTAADVAGNATTVRVRVRVTR